MLANAIHHFRYHVELLNNAPLIIVIGLGMLSFLCLMLWSELENPGSLVAALCFGFCIIFPATQMDWHHTEVRQGVEMQITVNNKQVWIPAMKLSNGEYWPTTFTRFRAHQ